MQDSNSNIPSKEKKISLIQRIKIKPLRIVEEASKGTQLRESTIYWLPLPHHYFAAQTQLRHVQLVHAGWQQMLDSEALLRGARIEA